MNAHSKYLPIILLMIAGAFTRLIPHLPNFTPTESITIFGAAYMGRKYISFIVPLVILYFADFLINNTVARSFFTEQEGIVWYDQYMLYNTIAIVFIVLLSSQFLSKITALNVVLVTLSSSVIFFIITNFGSWASEKSLYTNDLNGLMMSYTAGLPFFIPSLLGNIVFSVILFGSYEIIKQLVAEKSAEKI